MLSGKRKKNGISENRSISEKRVFGPCESREKSQLQAPQLFLIIDMPVGAASCIMLINNMSALVYKPDTTLVLNI
jgi:hypothetical protein